MEIDLDARGLKCPMPVLKLKRCLSSLEDGKIIIMAASDPASLSDVPAFCRELGHALLGVDNQNDHFLFKVQKHGALSAFSA